MCRRVAEGTQFRGCGHFTRTFVPAIVDCASKTCAKSVKHLDPCSSCARRRCIDHWGPDLQRVVRVSDDVCSGCKFQPGTHAHRKPAASSSQQQQQQPQPQQPPPPPPSWSTSAASQYYHY